MEFSRIAGAVGLLVAAFAVLSASGCAHPWRRYGKNCYLLHSGSKTYRDAERFCRDTSMSCANASLVSIEEEGEFFFIRDLVYRLMGKPTAFYMGAYTTPQCPGGAWTDRTPFEICTGEEGPCVHCDVIDEDCDIEKCMVASMQSWLASAQWENFTASVGGYDCTSTALPFVCKSARLEITS